MSTVVDRRRQTILTLVKAGRTNAEIARRLRISTRTLDRYRVADPDLNRAILAARAELVQLAPCGTPSAYARHLRRSEPVDEACRRANALAGRAQYARAKGAVMVDPTCGRPRRYSDVPVEPMPVPDLRTVIEQAIARGLPTSRIMSELAVDYRTVKRVRDRMAA